MALRGLGVRSFWERLPAVKRKTQHPASPRPAFAGLAQEGVSLPWLKLAGGVEAVRVRTRSLISLLGGKSAAFVRAGLGRSPRAGCKSASAGAHTLDRIAPAPLNIATALHAEATGAVSHGFWGVLRRSPKLTLGILRVRTRFLRRGGDFRAEKSFARGLKPVGSWSTRGFVFRRDDSDGWGHVFPCAQRGGSTAKRGFARSADGGLRGDFCVLLCRVL